METVLLYNIAQTPLASGLKPILLKMKVRIRVISPEQYAQPLGVLAGLPGFQELDNVYEGDGFPEPVIVLCGFTDQRLDQFLRELRRKTSSDPSESDSHPTQSELGFHNALSGIKIGA